ncbi:MAG TPA: hypothetical protein PKO41_09360 [Dokdonella sp.]|uniref:hypothetical protein n=1 Tax=Dokdonella sp. TaxID=2291710 RepID=UPI0025C1F8DB|nr:hypothetical protein [Dokdonella sp.]MBX3690764.1 hypothetical protein [Dokdonella sp.]HNR92619.1 hypothetical protein [Dokdonella sp.]
MGDAALELVGHHEAPDWNLRLAQQAFAELLEQRRRHSSFRVTAQRRSARRGLSALSADDRGRLERWLALQVVTAASGESGEGLDLLATVDPTLVAGVRAQLPRLRMP